MLVARTVVGGELLEFGTLSLRSDIPPEVERKMYRILGLTGIGAAVTYVCVLISAAVVLARAPVRLRDHAWMLMGGILLYLFVPVEVFVLSLDLRLAFLALGAGTDLAQMRELFLARAGALAGAPFVATMCYYTIIALAIFQPFRRRPDPTP
jgi:hypothetical protein